MGADRGGFYTYLLVENTLLRLGVHNADRIRPEWQDIEVGDHFWFTPENYPGPRQGPVIVDIESPQALILCEGKSAADCPGTWQFVLDGQNDGSTHLLFRDNGSSFADWILEPGFVVMNRGMLLGLQRATIAGIMTMISISRIVNIGSPIGCSADSRDAKPTASVSA
jgi:hypothetical protein